MSTSNSPITISSLDYERIETLLESDAAQNVPGIEALESELLRANVVEPSEVPPGLVTMNTTVKFEDLGTGQHRSLTLVYPHNATAPDSISVLTPVGSATGMRYTDCRDGAEVIFYSIAGGGHTWPGGNPLPSWITGETNMDISATETIWQFFRQYTLPAL